MDDDLLSRVIVLNQYLHGLSYKDVVGELYHFPSRYRNRFEELPLPFVYYVPREGGDQVYFGAGFVSEVFDVTEEPKRFYVQIVGYQPFPKPIDYFKGPDEKCWELPQFLRLRPLSNRRS